MTDRRYTDTEVAEIFKRAAEAQHSGAGGAVAPLASGEGMTLAQIQDIGREVGIPTEFIAHAARTVDRTGRPATKAFAGIPIGVSRTVDLPRQLTDAEWDRLVVDLRETFDARGKLRQDGAFRQWTNGNLQALLEPTEAGHRLRLRTRNGSAQLWMTGGLAVLGVAAVTLIAAISGDVPRDGGDMWSKFASMAVLGAGLFTVGAVRLPGWLRARRRQFEELAARVAGTAERPGS